MIRLFLLTEHDSEPFAIGTSFYGENLDEAIDAVGAEIE
jgi:hypothetical protein